MLKIKLYPTGKKNQISYRVVIAEAKSKRNGKYIANLGFYNPRTDPATVKIDKNKYQNWLQKGAQPTQTVRLLMEKL